MNDAVLFSEFSMYFEFHMNSNITTNIYHQLLFPATNYIVL